MFRPAYCSGAAAADDAEANVVKATNVRAEGVHSTGDCFLKQLAQYGWSETEGPMNTWTCASDLLEGHELRGSAHSCYFKHIDLSVESGCLIQILNEGCEK